MRAILFFLSVLVAAASAAEPPKVYRVLSAKDDADLDYALLQRLRERESRSFDQEAQSKPPKGGYIMLVGPKDLAPLFDHPVKGRYRVLTFCASQPVHDSDPDPPGPVDYVAHHLLVLKIDGKGRIVDGFYFMQEWCEAPMLHLLLRYHGKSRPLVKGLAISPTDFRQIGGGEAKYFDPTGSLDNRLGAKEAF